MIKKKTMMKDYLVEVGWRFVTSVVLIAATILLGGLLGCVYVGFKSVTTSFGY